MDWKKPHTWIYTIGFALVLISAPQSALAIVCPPTGVWINSPESPYSTVVPSANIWWNSVGPGVEYISSVYAGSCTGTLVYQTGGWITTYDPGYYLPPLAAGVYYVRLRARDPGCPEDPPLSAYAENSCHPFNMYGPNTPTVTSASPSPTNNPRPTWDWTTPYASDGTFRYKLDDSDLTTGATEDTATSYTPASDLSDGNHTLYVNTRDTYPNWSSTASLTINIDTTPPNTPSVTGTSPTNNVTPQWNWVPGGGGNGNYRYKLDDSDLTTGATTTGATTFTPGSALSCTNHTLYVQERDDAGNWSSNGSRTINIDCTPPNAPSVSGTSPTSDVTPEWNWSSGGGGNGNYRYKLDNSDLTTGATTTGATTFTPGSALSCINHTLYVQERDAAGNWSTSGSRTITIDCPPPNAPIVSGTSPTNDVTPQWDWSSGGGGNGNYRYKLDDSDLTTGATTTGATTFTPGSALSCTNHTLYVQERNGPGNWSTSGSRTINIDCTPPNTPTVNGPPTPTSDTTPTWTWSVNGGGNGTFRRKINSGSWTTTTATLYTPTLADGSYTLYIQERDDVGNWSASGSATVVIDITAPTVTITAPNGGSALLTPTATQTVSGTCDTDVNSIFTDIGTFSDSDCSIDGTWSLNPKILAEGVHVFTITAQDALLNTSQDTITIIVDLTPPSIAITAPNNGIGFSTGNSQAIVSGTCTSDAQNLSGLSTLPPGASFLDSDCSDGIWSLNPHLLNAGDNTYTIVGQDPAGNQNTPQSLVINFKSINPNTLYPNVAALAKQYIQTVDTATDCDSKGGLIPIVACRLANELDITGPGKYAGTSGGKEVTVEVIANAIYPINSISYDYCLTGRVNLAGTYVPFLYYCFDKGNDSSKGAVELIPGLFFDTNTAYNRGVQAIWDNNVNPPELEMTIEHLDLNESDWSKRKVAIKFKGQFFEDNSEIQYIANNNSIGSSHVSFKGNYLHGSTNTLGVSIIGLADGTTFTPGQPISGTALLAGLSSIQCFKNSMYQDSGLWASRVDYQGANPNLGADVALARQGGCANLPAGYINADNAFGNFDLYPMGTMAKDPTQSVLHLIGDNIGSLWNLGQLPDE